MVEHFTNSLIRPSVNGYSLTQPIVTKVDMYKLAVLLEWLKAAGKFISGSTVKYGQAGEAGDYGQPFPDSGPVCRATASDSDSTQCYRGKPSENGHFQILLLSSEP